jgi:maltooligosyltrehalose trehalohydrolase
MPFGALLTDGGVRFRLWAPAARSVHLLLANAAGTGARTVKLLMHRDAEGWYETTVRTAQPGSLYRFLVDGIGGLREVADPASRFQPQGAQGPSEVIDPAAYAWSSPERALRPWRELVFYELHVGTFTTAGTYHAAIERLPQLAELGITAVELMPLAAAPGRHNWGYDGVFPFAPSNLYGRPEDLKAFVEAAHALGFAVFLDVVYNHFGPQGNMLGLYAPQFFTNRVQTPWGAAIDFSGPIEVRSFFIHNALYWCEEFDVDGLRIDAAHMIVDQSVPDVLVETATRLVASGRRTEDGRAYAVLEHDANASRFLRVFAAQWDDDVHHALHVLVTGESGGYYADYLDDPAWHLGRALTEGFAFQGEPSPFRGGTPRGEPSTNLPATSFVTFLQNHDQIGNRAFGERIGQLAEHYKIRAAVALLLLAPPLPLLFMGEEWAASSPFLFFTDFEGELARSVREGREREFASFPGFDDEGERMPLPDPGADETFARSVLNWDERAREPHRSMLALYRDALRARKEHIVPLLARTRTSAEFGVSEFSPGALGALWRFEGNATLRVLANLSDKRADRLDYEAFDGRANLPIFAVVAPGEPPAAFERRLLSPWSVMWWLET